LPLSHIGAILVFIFAGLSFIHPHTTTRLTNGWPGVLAGGSIIFFT